MIVQVGLIRLMSVLFRALTTLYIFSVMPSSLLVEFTSLFSIAIIISIIFVFGAQESLIFLERNLFLQLVDKLRWYSNILATIIFLITLFFYVSEIPLGIFLAIFSGVIIGFNLWFIGAIRVFNPLGVENLISFMNITPWMGILVTVILDGEIKDIFFALISITFFINIYLNGLLKKLKGSKNTSTKKFGTISSLKVLSNSLPRVSWDLFYSSSTRAPLILNASLLTPSISLPLFYTLYEMFNSIFGFLVTTFLANKKQSYKSLVAFFFLTLLFISSSIIFFVKDPLSLKNLDFVSQTNLIHFFINNQELNLIVTFSLYFILIQVILLVRSYMYKRFNSSFGTIAFFILFFGTTIAVYFFQFFEDRFDVFFYILMILSVSIISFSIYGTRRNINS